MPTQETANCSSKAISWYDNRCSCRGWNLIYPEAGVDLNCLRQFWKTAKAAQLSFNRSGTVKEKMHESECWRSRRALRCCFGEKNLPEGQRKVPPSSVHIPIWLQKADAQTLCLYGGVELQHNVQMLLSWRPVVTHDEMPTRPGRQLFSLKEL